MMYEFDRHLVRDDGSDLAHGLLAGGADVGAAPDAVLADQVAILALVHAHPKEEEEEGTKWHYRDIWIAQYLAIYLGRLRHVVQMTSSLSEDTSGWLLLEAAAMVLLFVVGYLIVV